MADNERGRGSASDLSRLAATEHSRASIGRGNTSASPEVSGIKRIALALADEPRHIVPRAELRQLLPQGTTRWVGIQRHIRAMKTSGSSGSVNNQSRHFQEHLWVLEKAGAIRRIDGAILVLNRERLRRFGTGEEQIPTRAELQGREASS